MCGGFLKKVGAKVVIFLLFIKTLTKKDAPQIWDAPY